MIALKTIQGYRVEFVPQLRDRAKWIDVNVIGGGQGPAASWPEAWRMAHEMIELAKAYAFAAAREAAEKQAARTQRVQKHEAKQRRRAALQSAKARAGHV